AANSNLALGNAGPAAITTLMQDSDGSGSLAAVGANARVGHRRWLLFPQTREMGTGDVGGNGTTFLSANATWIIDANNNGLRPATREPFVAFPAPGYVPYQLVFPRWSFSYANADFSAATVAMTRAGVSIPVRLESIATGIGENTLAWIYDRISDPLATAESPGHARPSADLAYGVTISGVRVGATTLPPFTYTVTVFDPDTAGPDTVPVAVSGPASPGLGIGNTYTVAKPAFAAGFEWRTVALAAFSKVFNAEAGLDGLTATTTTGTPPVVQSSTVGAGTASYRLSHVSPRSTQLLTLPGTFLVGSGASVNFLSRLGIVTAVQTARVQASADDGSSWTDLYAQAGTSPTDTNSPASTDAAFANRTVSLSAYAGRTVRLRFAFTAEPTGIAFVPAATNTVGWFIDNVAVTGVQSATAGPSNSVAAGSTFSFTPTAADTVGLQARGVLFGAYPLEWGPPVSVNPLVAGDPANPARLINLSVLTEIAAAGDSFTLGYVVGGPPVPAAKPLVIRAAGPSLGALGVTGTLADPKLETFAAATSNGGNDDWGGAASLTAAFLAVGAFPYASPASKDAAVAISPASRDNSVAVSSANNGTGAVIAEVYDATPPDRFTPATPRLLNVSVRKHLGSGLTAGFVVGGTGAKTILIRAVGPGLAAFGVGGTVVDPQLTLFAGSTKIGENDDWGGTPALTAAFTSVGAFALPSATSKDAALLVSLPPGQYSVLATGAANTSGVALVEVYEVP
ncbi:MAG: hypothetical protein NTV51_03130, partial [Verrucomicrobia bacterium]|nr:hypothetical protein [Verrucomicrobiota bacterium]